MSFQVIAQRFLDEEMTADEMIEYLDQILSKVETLYTSQDPRSDLLVEASELLNALFDAIDGEDFTAVNQLVRPTQEALDKLGSLSLEEEEGEVASDPRHGQLPPNLRRLLDQVGAYRRAGLGRTQLLIELGEIEDRSTQLKREAESLRGQQEDHTVLMELFFAGIGQLEEGLDHLRIGIEGRDLGALDIGEQKVSEGGKLLVRAGRWLLGE